MINAKVTRVILALVLGVLLSTSFVATATAQETVRSLSHTFTFSDPCVAGSCQAKFAYTPEDEPHSYTVEVEWDNHGAATQFVPDVTYTCDFRSADAQYDPDFCSATSPPYTAPGVYRMYFRVTNEQGATGMLDDIVQVLDPADQPAPLVVKAPKVLTAKRTIMVYSPKEQLTALWFSDKAERQTRKKFTGYGGITRSAARLSSGPYSGMFRFRVKIYAPPSRLSISFEASNEGSRYGDTVGIDRRFKGKVGPYAGLRGSFYEIGTSYRKIAARIHYVALKPSRYRVRVRVVKRVNGHDVVVRRARSHGRTAGLWAGSYSLGTLGEARLKLSAAAWQSLQAEACNGTVYTVVARLESWTARGKRWAHKTLRYSLVPPDCSSP